jgi:outer membrane receptor for ferrienterochelin and colicin
MRKFKGPLLSKDEKLLGVDTCREMESMATSQLEDVIVQANASIKQAKDELEKNPNYQDVKSKMRDLTGAFNDLKRRQNGKIAFALKLRESRGK